MEGTSPMAGSGLESPNHDEVVVVGRGAYTLPFDDEEVPISTGPEVFQGTTRDKLLNKLWKVRKQGLEELSALIAVKDTSVSEYSLILSQLCSDINQQLYEQFLDVLTAWLSLQKASSGFSASVSAVVPFILDKFAMHTRGSAVVNTKCIQLISHALEGTDQPLAIIEGIAQRFRNKNGKVALSNLALCCSVVKEFGVFDGVLKAILHKDVFIHVAHHTDGRVRKEINTLLKQLTMYGYGDTILKLPYFTELRDAQQKEFTSAIEDAKKEVAENGVAKPVKFNAFESQKKATNSKRGGSAEDAMSLAGTAVVVPKLPSDFIDFISSNAKWVERKDKLQILHDMTYRRMLHADEDWAPIVKLLRRLLNDTQIAIQVLAIKCIHNMCTGLRLAFSAHAKGLLTQLLDKHREKRGVIVEPLGACLQSIVDYCANVVEYSTEEINALMKSKISQVKEGTMEFISSCVAAFDQKKDRRRVAKIYSDLQASLASALNDAVASVRNIAAKLAATFAAALGWHAVSGILAKLDAKVKAKVNELCVAKGIAPMEVDDTPPAPPAPTKQASKRPAPDLEGPAAKRQKVPVVTEPLEVKLNPTKSDVNSQLKDLLCRLEVPGSNPVAKLQILQCAIRIVEGSTQGSVTIATALPQLKPRLKDSNVQILLVTLQLIAALSNKATVFSREMKSTSSAILALITQEKRASVKTCAFDTLRVIAGVAGIQSFAQFASEYINAQPPPKKKELTQWLNEVIEASRPAPRLIPEIQDRPPLPSSIADRAFPKPIVPEPMHFTIPEPINPLSIQRQPPPRAALSPLARPPPSIPTAAPMSPVVMPPMMPLREKEGALRRPTSPLAMAGSPRKGMASGMDSPKPQREGIYLPPSNSGPMPMSLNLSQPAPSANDRYRRNSLWFYEPEATGDLTFRVVLSNLRTCTTGELNEYLTFLRKWNSTSGGYNEEWNERDNSALIVQLCYKLNTLLESTNFEMIHNVLSTLHDHFSNPTLMVNVSGEIVSLVFYTFFMALDRLQLVTHTASFSLGRWLSIASRQMVDNCNLTSVACGLVLVTQKRLSQPESLQAECPKFLTYVRKCLMKWIGRYQQNPSRLSIFDVMVVCDRFFDAHPPSSNQPYAEAVRLVKTILYEISKAEGRIVKDFGGYHDTGKTVENLMDIVVKEGSVVSQPSQKLTA